MFLLYKYKPVCSIHNITYWLIKKGYCTNIEEYQCNNPIIFDYPYGFSLKIKTYICNFCNVCCVVCTWVITNFHSQLKHVLQYKYNCIECIHVVVLYLQYNHVSSKYILYELCDNLSNLLPPVALYHRNAHFINYILIID